MDFDKIDDFKTRKNRMGRSYFMEGVVDMAWWIGVIAVALGITHIVYRFTLWNPPIEAIGTLIHNLIS